MATWIVPLAVDPIPKRPAAGKMLSLGPKMQSTIAAVVKESQRLPHALVCVPVGRNPRWGVYVGEQLVIPTLQKAGVSSSRIRHTRTYAYTTNKEMYELVRWIHASPDSSHHVVLIARWWHLPRAWLLLRARLGKQLSARVSIHPIPVSSLAVWSLLFREPAAWIWNLVQGNFFEKRWSAR